MHVPSRLGGGLRGGKCIGVKDCCSVEGFLQMEGFTMHVPSRLGGGVRVGRCIGVKDCWSVEGLLPTEGFTWGWNFGCEAEGRQQLGRKITGTSSKG